MNNHEDIVETIRTLVQKGALDIEKIKHFIPTISLDPDQTILLENLDPQQLLETILKSFLLCPSCDKLFKLEHSSGEPSICPICGVKLKYAESLEKIVSKISTISTLPTETEARTISKFLTTAKNEGLFTDEEVDIISLRPDQLILFCNRCKQTFSFDKLTTICPKCFEKLQPVGTKRALEVIHYVGDASIPAFFAQRYRILRKLGAGGFGVVFEAFDFELNRICALKIANIKGAEEYLKRFYREVAITAKLEHPNIVKIYEFRKEGGVFFYSMEFLRGEPLNKLIEAGTISQGAALRIIRDCALALHHAHLKGVIHRDIKPHNIMIIPQEEITQQIEESRFDTSLKLPTGLMASNYRAVLMDFGIAKIIQSTTFSTQLTQTGDVFGTPQYMSPEQAAGLVRKIGPCSDIYSLGVVLYQLISGDLPFKGSDAYEIIMKIQQEEIEPIRNKVKYIHPDLEAIIMKATMKEPAMRYATALDFAQDCENFLRGEPVKARRPSLAYVIRQKIKKNWKILLPIATTLLALMGYFVISAIVSYIRYVNMEREFLSAKQKIQNQAIQLMQSAQQKFNAGEYDKAIELSQEVFKYEKYTQKDKFPKNEFQFHENFEKYIPFDISLANASLLTSKAYLKKGEKDKAKLHVLKALTLATKDEEKKEALLYAGKINLESKLLMQADYYFSLLHANFPQSQEVQEVLFYRGYIQFCLGKYEIADVLLSEYLKKVPQESTQKEEEFITPAWKVKNKPAIAELILEMSQSLYPAKPLPFQVSNVGAADLDGDGKDEIIIDTTDGELIILKNEDSNLKVIDRTNARQKEWSFVQFAFADINKDGKQEIIHLATHYQDGEMKVYTLSQNKLEVMFTDPAEGAYCQIAVSDVTGDRIPDIIIGYGPYKRTICIYTIIEQKFKKLLEYPILSDPCFIKCVDVDDDSINEIILGTGPWDLNTAYRLHCLKYDKTSNQLKTLSRQKVGEVINGVYLGEAGNAHLFAIIVFTTWQSQQRIFERLGIQYKKGITIYSLSKANLVFECLYFTEFDITIENEFWIRRALPQLRKQIPVIAISPTVLFYNKKCIVFDKHGFQFITSFDANGDGKFGSVFREKDTIFISGLEKKEKQHALVPGGKKMETYKALKEGMGSFIEAGELETASQYLGKILSQNPHLEKEATLMLIHAYKENREWNKLKELLEQCLVKYDLDILTRSYLEHQLNTVSEILALPKRISFDFGTKSLPLLSNSPLSFKIENEVLKCIGNSAQPASIKLPIKYDGGTIKVVAESFSRKMEWAAGFNINFSDLDSNILLFDPLVISCGDTDIPEFHGRVYHEQYSDLHRFSSDPLEESQISINCMAIRGFNSIVSSFQINNERRESEIKLKQIPYFRRGAVSIAIGPYGIGHSFSDYCAVVDLKNLCIYAAGNIVIDEFNPIDSSDYFLRAGGRYILGDYKGAIEDYITALNLPFNARDEQKTHMKKEEAFLIANLTMAMAYNELRQKEKAMGILQNLLKENPEELARQFKKYFHALTSEQKELLKELFRKEMQATEFIKAVESKKLGTSVAVYVFPELLQVGNTDEAFNMARTLVYDAPASAIKLCEEVLIPAYEHYVPEKLSREERLKVARVYNTIGQAYYFAGRIKEAVEWLKKAHKMCPQFEDKDEELENSIRWYRGEIEDNLKKALLKLGY